MVIKKDNKTKTAPKLLRALYDMLHYEDPDILAWSHDGAFFQVFDVHRLEREVLTKYFKHNKFTSLQRQLNNFGFHKWTKTRANVCTFSHDVLRRCHPDQLPAMVHNSEKVMAARASHFESASAKQTRSESEAKALRTSRTKRLCSKLHPAEAAYDDTTEPEAAPPCLEALDGPQYLLDGFKQTDLCSLDWSLVTDQIREDDLLALIDPLMNEPAVPVSMSSEPQHDLSPESLPPTDVELFVGSALWMDVLDEMVADS